MNSAEISNLTNDQLAKAIADIGDHPFAERFVREQASRAAAADDMNPDQALPRTPDPQTAHEVSIIRHNWARLGYVHHLNDYGTEYWRHPDTGHVVEFYEWGTA